MSFNRSLVAVEVICVLDFGLHHRKVVPSAQSLLFLGLFFQLCLYAWIPKLIAFSFLEFLYPIQYT